jgi:polar amino acid transport system substrate-binding protein
MLRSIRSLTTVSLTIALAACTSAGPSVAPSQATPTEIASAPATPAATPDACAIENLQVVTPGTLTVATDNPAYPPYFALHDGPYPEPWKNLGYTGDPTSGEGFESAVAYAVADELGFSKDEVTWIVVPFNKSFAPGKKSFDFDINQISYTPDRAGSVDMSDGYYSLNQAVVALKANDVASATSIADLTGYKFGAQVGTTSYQTIQDVIQPTKEASVYDTNDAAIAALKGRQIDAIVVDLPTADYIVNVQVPRRRSSASSCRRAARMSTSASCRQGRPTACVIGQSPRSGGGDARPARAVVAVPGHIPF